MESIGQGLVVCEYRVRAVRAQDGDPLPDEAAPHTPIPFDKHNFKLLSYSVAVENHLYEK